MSATQPERDEETGKFTSDTRRTVYDAVPKDGTPCRAREVANDTGIPRTTVNYHLNKLADEGCIMKKKFHEKRVVWWFDEDQNAEPSADGRADPEPVEA